MPSLFTGLNLGDFGSTSEAPKGAYFLQLIPYVAYLKMSSWTMALKIVILSGFSLFCAVIYLR
ncbi:MAG: hypothetical protein ACI8YQ_001717 [Polaribacter sp.]|jgi:hypothetical protein